MAGEQALSKVLELQGLCQRGQKVWCMLVLDSKEVWG